MVMMVRQQMICIVAPAWPGQTSFSQSFKDALEKFFLDVDVVHFSSIALLPAIPGQQDKPSLMLELVAEEGLSPADLLHRLVFHSSGTMWTLFGAYWSAQPAPVSLRNQQLLDRLMEWHHVADGGFVGARDRSVRQIEMERKLLEQTRHKARSLKATYGHDRTAFARALSRWAFDDPNGSWATEPAPRSFWRGKGAGIGAKLAYPVLYVAYWLALLWLVGPLSRMLARADRWLFGDWNTAVQLAAKAAADLSGYLLASSFRFLLALAVLAAVLLVFLVALPALFVFYRRWLERLHRAIDRPAQTWSSTFAYVGIWLLLLAAIWCIGVYTFDPDDFVRYTIGPLMRPDFGQQQLVIGGLVIAVLLVIAVVWSRRDGDVDRAQQVHPSIEACEAERVGGTAHMISLTDIRSPTWWSAWWTRFFLRLVTLIGYVFFTEGRLGGAPGIHFGHWHVIEGGRRFLFCSNYDGNFGGYLDDFINGASAGTTLFWRWTKLKPRRPAATDHPGVTELRHFPPSRFLAFRGVKCELRFKSYARDSMLPHLYHFDACKLTVDRIIRATTLRDALFGERNESNDDQIMRAIES